MTTVTAVTAVTAFLRAGAVSETSSRLSRPSRGAGSKVKGAYLRVEFAARQYNPYPLTFGPRRTLAGWWERLCLSHLRPSTKARFLRPQRSYFCHPGKENKIKSLGQAFHVLDSGGQTKDFVDDLWFRLRPKPPRPRGKATRYECSQRDCGPSDTSPGTLLMVCGGKGSAFPTCPTASGKV